MSSRLQAARFYAILDTGYVPREALLDKCRALLAGGADIIQLRAKGETPDERIEILDTLVPLFADTDVPLVVNDDLEAALRFPGVGLHVGQDDLSAAEARDALGPERVLGLSTHTTMQAQRAIKHAALLDYFAVGPVFATPTKPDYIPVGLQLVRQVAEMQPPLPWFAIGGVKRYNLAQVLGAGARRVVAVSDALCAEDSTAAVAEYQKALAAIG